MTSFITKKVAKHVLKESAENKFGSDDPYFEYIAPVDVNGNAGKPKKQKRATPPGLNKREEKLLKKVTRRAYRLDNCLNFCGIRFGWSTVVGIVPALGDVLDVLMALMVFRTCTQAELPAALKSRMIFNIILDFAIGLVPVLGDIGDAFFRCNTKNAALLYNHLRARGRARIEGDDKVAREKAPGQERLPSHKQARAQPISGGSLQSTQVSQDGGSNIRAQSSQQRFVTPGDTTSKLGKAESRREKGFRGGWLGRFVSSNRTSKDSDQADLENGEGPSSPSVTG